MSKLGWKAERKKEQMYMLEYEVSDTSRNGTGPMDRASTIAFVAHLLTDEARQVGVGRTITIKRVEDE